MNKLKILSLDHVVFNVVDPERSVGFYSGLLGFESVRLDEFRSDSAPFPSVRIDARTIIDFFRRPDAIGSSVVPNVNHIALTFENTADEIRAFLNDRGIEIVREMTGNFGARGDCAHSFQISDPDGNLLELQAYEYSRSVG